MKLGDILGNRYASIEDNSKNVTTDTSIELPAEISQLITGNDYWRRAKTNRYKKLIQEGHLNDLLDLAEQAMTKDTPANWFARAASKAQWQRTLDYLAKLKDIAQKALEVAQRIVARPDQMKVVYGACWRSKDVIRHAITAQETGRDTFKYFCWLVWGQKDGTKIDIKFA
jgi:biotin synthase-related radical SAM superfamily protein